LLVSRCFFPSSLIAPCFSHSERLAGKKGYQNNVPISQVAFYVLIPVFIASTMLFFLDMDLGPDHPVRQLYGLAHFAFFAFMARCLAGFSFFYRKHFWFQFCLIMVFVFIAGGLIELIQPYFGRTASWRDVGFNLLGGCFGLIFFMPSGRCKPGRRFLLLAKFVVLAFAIIMFSAPAMALWDMRRASRQFPVLGDFESRLETRRWSRGKIDKGFARHGRASLQVPLETGKKYPGTSLLNSFGDWTGYSFFAFSVHNPDPEPLFLKVSIRDHKHFRRGGRYKDRFNRSFQIEQGWNDISIPLEDIKNAPFKRTLELDNLTEVVFFTVDLPELRLMHLDYVRLIP
jgi:VanZ family protein